MTQRRLWTYQLGVPDARRAAPSAAASRFAGKTLCTALVALALTVGGPLAARGQGVPPPETDRSFPVQLWQPALGPQGYFTVDSARVPAHLGMSLTLSSTYQRNPFTLKTVQGLSRVEESVEVVRDQVATELGFAIGLIGQLQLGVAIPFVAYQTGDDFTNLGTASGADLSGASLGDIRLELKYQVVSFGPDEAFTFALVPGLSLPTGDDEKFNGDKNVTGRLRGVLEYRRDNIRAAVTLGGLFRQPSTNFAATVGQQLLYGAAVEGKVYRDVSIIGEIFGRSGFEDFLEGYTDAHPIEADAGMRVGLPKMFSLTAGGGLGVVRGIGAPVYRAFLLVGWTPNFADRDGDGIADSEDRCIDTPEDLDDFKDSDGCPDLDNDGDGIPDASDRCPNVAEDLDQFQDEDGCPEEDNDGDGIADIRDPCPNAKEDHKGKKPNDGCPATAEDADNDGVPDASDRCHDEQEDRDGFEDNDGCPDPDNDNDSIPDGYDECPNEAEDADGVEDADGCPDLDNDKDGFPDAADKCPAQAETLNGNRDDDGCPDPGAELVKLTPTAIELRERINFTGKADAPTLPPASQTLLNLVALVIKGHADIATVTIEVNADGAASGYTQARADAILAFLVGKGVAGNRLKAVGAGPGGNKVTFQVEHRTKKGASLAPPGL
jgi:OmpA-OmpF porin, OOP family